MMHKFLAPTGRMSAFLKDPSKGILPASCTVYKLQNATNHADYLYTALPNLFHFVIVALMGGAGVNVHLDGFRRLRPMTGKLTISMEYDPLADLRVQDSMLTDPKEDKNGDMGIIPAIGATLFNLNRDFTIDLSPLRPEGVVGSKGQISSGPESFAKIFRAVETFAHNPSLSKFLALLSEINGTVRRGGVFKNGALTTSYPIWGPFAQEYLTTNPVEDHPWVRRGIVLNQDCRQTHPDLMKMVYDLAETGSLWYEKAIYRGDNQTWLNLGQIDEGAPRLLHNVCREVLLDPECTCILLPLNLGQVQKPVDLATAYTLGMRTLTDFHARDTMTAAGIYKPADQDRQVGLGIIGLANMLSLAGISYQTFVESFETYIDTLEVKGIDGITNLLKPGMAELFVSRLTKDYPADEWVENLIEGVAQAAEIAHDAGMRRAFAIAPTASVSYRFKDHAGFTTAPEIAPPIGRQVERLTNTESDLGTEVYDYGDVEIAEEVGFDIYARLVHCFQRLFDMTGLGHAISMNVWVPMDERHFEEWSKSAAKSTYYRIPVDTQYLDKSDQLGSNPGDACIRY